MINNWIIPNLMSWSHFIAQNEGINHCVFNMIYSILSTEFQIFLTYNAPF